MNEADLEQRLGIPPGETLKALVALAHQITPEHPSEAFEPLWLRMSWLERGPRVGHGTPRNVHPFAETGGDLNHFGFLMDDDRPTDERPIVCVVPRDDDEATQIVAPNLRAFLGLIAVAFGEVISRQSSDAEWFGYREEWYGDNSARLAEMTRLSDLLCTIPGVAKPSSPSKVADAYPNQRFRLRYDDADDADDDDDDEGHAEGALNTHQASSFAQLALDEGRYDEAIEYAQSGVLDPAYRPRCMFVRATALARLGREHAADAVVDDLLRDWFDDAPVSLPAVHARSCIGRDELVALVERVKGIRGRSFVRRIRSTRELDLPKGDVL